jgi:DNA-binding PadR family transcriptional regulator
MTSMYAPGAGDWFGGRGWHWLRHVAEARAAHGGEGPRRSGRGRGWGPGDAFGAPRYGFGPGWDDGGFGRSRRGAGRGKLRAAVLALLAEQPRHGYDIITELGQRSGGLWKPSPGSVYPLLQQLQDEGLVTSTEDDGRRIYRLTDAGRTWVEDNKGGAQEPWEAHGPHVPEGTLVLLDGFRRLAAAGWQVAHTGNAAQVAEAGAVLDEARRALYRILAGDDAGEGSPADG